MQWGASSALLAKAGEDVVFIARGDTLEALSSRGLRIERPDSDVFLGSVHATDDPASVGPVDAVILGVKAWQVREACEQMRPLIRTGERDAEEGGATPVLPLQNGVDAPADIRAVLGEAHALGGTSRVICMVRRPGVVEQSAFIQEITLGELDNQITPRLGRLRAALDEAGVQTVVPEDIQVAIWRKFLLMAATGGIGSLTRSTFGEFRAQHETRELLRRFLEEIASVGRARGVRLPDDAVERMLAFIDTMPEETTASMQRDVMGGRPSELDAQCGAVVRMGRDVGVPTPVAAFCYHALLPQERRARRSADSYRAPS